MALVSLRAPACWGTFPRQPPPTFLQPWSRFSREAMLRKALIRAAKPSHTAGTLCEIAAKLLKLYNRLTSEEFNFGTRYLKYMKLFLRIWTCSITRLVTY
jgi:hypothetical protein